MAPNIVAEETYLGFDLSTQKLKAVQLNSKLEVLVQAEVKFDIDLPEFGTSGGVNAGQNKNEFYVLPNMWVKALDMILDRLVVHGANLSTVACISGSAQQHGSVFWNQNGINILKNLDCDKFLHVQLSNSAYSIKKSPIWMDGSTEKQCKDMEELVGGRDEMVKITGSKCYGRFTGPQIRKIYENDLKSYQNTERISLVSSFLASIFLGDVAPIDHSDASGMNLFDIKAKRWSQTCLQACAPDVEKKLGEPMKTCSIIGNIGQFFVQRYNFQSNCKITAFTGDNPSALTGMLIGEDWLALSLGTSDTIMMDITDPPHLAEGHVLCHPTNPLSYMGLLCFRNGSLVRDLVKRVEANNNWDFFSHLLDSAPRGNNGNMAIHFHSQEIIPCAKGSLKWNSNHNQNNPEGVNKFTSPQIEVRALIEGQMLHRKAVAEDMGFNFGENTKILATGGASVNRSILQVISDVFNAPLYVQKTSEAALLGAAFRAKYCLYTNNKFNGKFDINGSTKNHEDFSETYQEYILKFLPNILQRVCDPCENSELIYASTMERYREMLKVLEKRIE